MTSHDSQDYDLIDRLAEDFAARYRRGERPSLQEYIDRHPNQADAIRELLPAMVEIEQVKEDIRFEAQPAPPIHQMGDYHILRELGRGGMGVVYEAEQVSLGRRVALKLLPQRMLLDARQKRRFEREARAAAKLHHTNIVPVFGVGEHEGMPYYVMQFIQGLGLDEVVKELKKLRPGHSVKANQAAMAETCPPESVRQSAVELARSLASGCFQARRLSAEEAGEEGRGPATPTLDESPGNGAAEPVIATATPLQEPLPASTPSASLVVLPGQSGEAGTSSARSATYWQSVARIGVQVADALDYAHRQGILHRDIKPSNLLLDMRGTGWVTDFGLAKLLGTGWDAAENLTQTGDVLGTLRYLSPEAFDGKVDARADVYALGLTLYELLAFRPAFDERDRSKLIKQVTSADPPRLDRLNSAIPRDLVTVVHKALEREPRLRYETAAELGADLQRFVNDEPVKARRLSIGERCRRWCRRNQAVAGLTAVVFLLLVAVAVVASVGLVQTRHALKREEEQRQAAEEEGVIAVAAEAKATAAETKARAAAEQSRQDAARSRRSHYDADMSLAAQIWDSPTGSARAVADLLDAHIPATGQDDLRDFVWRYQWRLLHGMPTLGGHKGGVWVACSPGGQVLTLDQSPVLRGWNKLTGREVWRRAPPELPKYFSAEFSRDSTLLATGTSAGNVALYHTATGQLRSLIQGGPAVLDVTFAASGQKLVSLHADRKARVWDGVTGKELEGFLLEGRSFRASALSPDGKTLVLGDHPKDYEVTLYRAGQRQPQILKTWGGTVRSVACSPNGRWLASGNSDGQVDLWDAATGKARGTMSAHQGDVTRLEFSPDSTLLATGGAEGLVTLWAVGNTLRYVKLKGHTGSITYLAFFPDGKTLGSASNDGTVRIWDLTSPQESRTLGMLPGKYEGRHIAYSPDGRWLAVAGDPAGLWDARTGLLIRQFGAAYRVAFSPDGKTLATGGEDSRLQIWDVGTKQLIRTLGVKPHEPDMPRNTVGALSFSPDGKLLAAGFGWRQWFVNEDHEQWARIWDWTSGREIARLPHKNTVAGLAFSPDGHLLATASHDRGVRLWSVASWRQTRHWNGPDTFDSVAFAPGGGILAAGGGDGLIRLWKVDSGAALPPLNGHSNHVMDLAFAPDGKTLASASWDRTLKLWDVTSGRALRSIGHANQLQAVAFARDGKTLVSSGIDMVHFWDTLSSIQREQEALAQLTELLSQRPDDIDAYLSRARIYLTREQWAEAFRDTNRAVELHPNNLNARLLRAPVLTHMRQWDKALADYAFIRARGLTNAPLRTQYGDLLGLTEKWTEAAAVFGQLAEEKASSYSMPWYSGYRQAVALAAAGKDEEYRRACQRMFDRFHDTDDLQAAWFTAWGCALKPGALADYGPVLQLAQRALARNSESSRSHDIVGALLYRAGKHEEARRELEAADNTADWAVTSPAYCWYYLAMVHFRLGHKQDGEKWYQRAATQTDQELKDWTNKAEPALWVRKASLQVLHREAEALRRESVR